jgi:glutamate carboxypeptidase
METSLPDKIGAFVRANSKQQLQFVIDLCNINSYTYNPEGTGAVADLVLKRLGGILPDQRAIEEKDVGNHHVLRSGKEGRAIYLLGHTDTVFPPDHPFQECHIDGEWLTGPGTGDMKGGLAVIVYALKALDAVGLLDRLNLTLALGADEEIGSVTSRRIYEQESEAAAACLVAECAGSGGEIVVSRNGKVGTRLDCFGTASHVARTPGEKASAILSIAHKIIALESLNGCFPGVTLNVGTIEGGLGPCTIAAHASCLIDMRWTQESHREPLLDKARKITAANDHPGCRCELTLLNHRPAMPLTEATANILAKLSGVAKSLGISLETEHRRGTSDANYFGSAGVPTLDGLGPVCEDDHTPNERILVSSLAARTALLALFLAEHGPTLMSD